MRFHFIGSLMIYRAKKLNRLFCGLVACTPLCMGFDLTAAYQKSLDFNADYLSAIAQNEAGQELQVQGKASLLPQVSGVGGVTEAYLSSGSSNVTYFQPSTSAMLQQVVYDFNKFSAYSKSKFATQLSDLQFINAQQQLIVKVGQAYFNVLYAEDSLQSVQMTKTALDKQLEQAQRAFKIGSATIADVNDAQSGYDTATAEEIQAQNEVINQKNIFANVTGLNPDMVQPIVEQINLDYPTPRTADEWADLAKTGNLNIKIAQKQVDIAMENINIAKAGHLPSINFTGSFNIQGTANIQSVDSVATQQLVNTLQATPGFPMSSYTGAIALLQVSIPIYSGGSVSSLVRERISDLETSRNSLLDTQRQTDKDTRDAFLRVSNGVEIVKAQAQALKSAKIKLHSDKLGYQVGIRNSINLVNSEKNYYQTWRAYNQARYQYLISRLQLEYLAGKINDNFLIEINGNIKQ